MVGDALGRVGARVAAGAGRFAEWVRAWTGEWAKHPLRLTWTLLVSLALFSAVWPLVHAVHGWWMHAASWGYLVNHQNDYGEGPLFNQQVIMYHLLFNHGNPLYHGQNIYQLGEHPPFAVGNYPPVFQFVTAIFMHFYGLTFTAGRLVSSLSIVGAAILIGLIVWEGTRQVLPAILGGGLLITMSLGIWSWGPFNRVDSNALFWSMLTVWLAVRYAGTRKVWWVLPAAVLTIYTRQSMVDGILAAFCYMLVRDWRRGVWVGVATGAAILGVFVLLQIWTHGAFYLNTVVDNENAYSFGGALSNWHRFIAGEGRFLFPLAVAGAAAGLVGRGSVLWAIWLAGSVFVFATIGKTGAASNYYFTLEAATAACAALFVGRLRTFFRGAPFPVWPLELLLPGMLFLYVHGSPPKWLPARMPLVQQAMSLVGSYKVYESPAMRAAHLHFCKCWARPPEEGMVAYLRTVSGPVVAIDFPHAVSVQAGHQMQWQPFEFSVAYNDGTWNPAPFVAAIRDRYYAVIYGQQIGGYIGGAASGEIDAALRAEYHYDRTISGYQIWLPNSPPGVAPPTISQQVPKPLPALGRAVVQHVEGLPLGMWHALTRRVDPPHLKGVGAFTEVGILPQLNLIGVEQPGRAASDPQGFDGSGNFLSTKDFPRAGTFNVSAPAGRVPFFIPQSGSTVRSLVQLDGPTTVRLPAGRDTALWLLEGAANGPQRTAVTLRYASGPPGQSQVSFSDWCAAPVANETLAFRGPDRLDARGADVTPACGMFAMRIPVDTTRALDAVSFAVNPKIVLAAVTVQR